MPASPLHRRRRATGHFAGHFSGARCRKERCRLGVTQLHLALIAGVSERCLRRFEQGVNRPHRSTVEALFGALHRCAREEVKRLQGAS